MQGIRYGDYKFTFVKQDKWFNGVQESMTTPYITNLKIDPFERFFDAPEYEKWQESRAWMMPLAMEHS